jgi:CheY-like chemotaxis protein
VRFELDLGHRLAPVSVDEARFEAALLNLVVNAHDAMPDGGTLVVETRNITLAANAVAALPAGDYVRVVVRDSGTGMMPAVRERALEPFFTTKDVGKGTGLGLSQVYGFIVQSGGEVVIDTAVGFGTSISLYLPALTEHAVVAASVAPVEECVLIVEDDPLLMATANELFQIMGYRVLTAEDGVQAMQMLAREPDVNVLFSDILMPNGMSGLDLAREVRQRYPDMRVILASGYPNPALVGQQSVEQFSFVSKPYRVADLARLLRTSNQA